MQYMIQNPDAMFEVHGFTPPSPDITMGGYGFEVRLQLSFAQGCSELNVDATALARLERRCRDNVIERTFHKASLEFHRHPTLRFYQSSLLLVGVEVPGVNGCWLALESDQFHDLTHRPLSLDRRQALTYTTHNVDTQAQAFALLSCWLHWHRGAVATMKTMRAAGPVCSGSCGCMGDDPDCPVHGNRHP